MNGHCGDDINGDAALCKKLHIIESTIDKKCRNIKVFQQFAIARYGLINNDIRKTVWPILLGIDPSEPIPVKPDQKKLKAHAEYNQVVMDVDRSLKRFPPGMKETVRLSMQDQLIDIIMWVLVHNKELHYYQGYHDIVVTFLLVLGSEELAFLCMEKLSRSHLREHMYPTIEATSRLLDLIPILLRTKTNSGSQIADLLERFELPSSFAISWVITWFGHVLPDLPSILRLYDFFLATDPLMPVYTSTACVLECADKVLSLPEDMLDFAVLYSSLTHAPTKPPAPTSEQLVRASCSLFLERSPSKLRRSSVTGTLLLPVTAAVSGATAGARRLPAMDLKLLIVGVIVLLLAVLIGWYFKA